MLHISRTERNFTIAFLIFYVLAAAMSIPVQLTDYITGLSSVMYSFFIIGLPVLTLDAASCVGKSERMKTPAGLPAGVLFCAVTVFIAVRGCLQRLRKAADLNRSRSRR